MILSSSFAIDRPYQYLAAIRTALEWITSHDLANMEAGTYEPQGRDIYVNIQDIVTKPIEECLPERHNDYLDIQYVVSGVERMGYAPHTGKETVQWDVPDKDIIIYKDLEHENFVDVAPGSYCIFFPTASIALLFHRQLWGGQKSSRKDKTESAWFSIANRNVFSYKKLNDLRTDTIFWYRRQQDS